jgi:DNA-binding beta-propeller fold protein YncE
MKELLVPDAPWKLVAEGFKEAGGLAANAKGDVVFTDSADGKGFVVGQDGKVSPAEQQVSGISGQAFGPNGKLISLSPNYRGISVEGLEHCHSVVAAHDGSVYVTEPASGKPGTGKIGHASPKKEVKVFDSSLAFPTGITVSPDQSLLYVADGHSHWIWSFQIATDGSLINGQRFHCLHVPEWADHADVGGLAVDRTGRLYCATNMGIQVCDQAGRVNAILPLPSGRATDLCFGGEGFHTLFVTCGDRVYSRKLKVEGAQAFAEPIKPAPPPL